MICPICCETFTPAKHNQRYCGTVCKRRAWNNKPVRRAARQDTFYTILDTLPEDVEFIGVRYSRLDVRVMAEDGALPRYALLECGGKYYDVVDLHGKQKLIAQEDAHALV